MSSKKIKRIATLKDATSLKEYISELGIDLKFDNEVNSGQESVLGNSYTLGNGFKIGNRFCILPMEGWDGTDDGKPSNHTFRRWKNFGESGAKLIWGGEAVAVRHDGRSNPNQLVINQNTIDSLKELLEHLETAHEKRFGSTDDLLVGLQLTHSGRFSCPTSHGTAEPQIAYHHPELDKKFNKTTPVHLLTESDLDALVQDYITGAQLASQAGYKFVDIKHCHGYLAHELLSNIDKKDKYSGSFENRTRFLKNIVSGIRSAVPEMEIGVRLSAFDFAPYILGENNIGTLPDDLQRPYNYAFGGDKTGNGIDLKETYQFLDLLSDLDIELVCITGGSPYYNPHIQRPAAFPPSDGYLPPEDPLIGVARQIGVTATLKAHNNKLLIVGSCYSYLQDWLPNFAQYNVRNNLVDFVGLGRMVLSYPDLPADVLEGKELKRKTICRTFSDCTTAPRHGIISGCYPLDPYYKSMELAKKVKAVKKSEVPR
jgi:2,4-dienoyl-CoA reductase-like NADH-dependent reductase (Old Yellow Enzyme family)